MEFAEHVTDGTGGFLELGPCRKPQLRHGVDNPSLYRFESVADVRQSAIENDVHGVIQVRFFRESMNWERFYSIKGGIGCHARSVVVTNRGLL